MRVHAYEVRLDSVVPRPPSLRTIGATPLAPSWVEHCSFPSVQLDLGYANLPDLISHHKEWIHFAKSTPRMETIKMFQVLSS